MAELMVMGCNPKFLMEKNLVKIEGLVENTGKTPVERTVQLYKAGTSDMIAEAQSDSSDGTYLFVIQGEVSDDLRVEAFADENENDENSQVHDLVNPVQHTTLV